MGPVDDNHRLIFFDLQHRQKRIHRLPADGRPIQTFMA
jgi:hypothetical protein